MDPSAADISDTLITPRSAGAAPRVKGLRGAILQGAGPHKNEIVGGKCFAITGLNVCGYLSGIICGVKGAAPERRTSVVQTCAGTILFSPDAGETLSMDFMEPCRRVWTSTSWPWSSEDGAAPVTWPLDLDLRTNGPSSVGSFSCGSGANKEDFLSLEFNLVLKASVTKGFDPVVQLPRRSVFAQRACVPSHQNQKENILKTHCDIAGRELTVSG